MERVERMLLSLHRGMTISVHYQRLLLSWNGRARLLAGAGLGHFPGYVNGQTAFGTVLFPLGLRCPYGFRAHHFEAGLSFTATATTNDAGPRPSLPAGQLHHAVAGCTDTPTSRPEAGRSGLRIRHASRTA